MEGGVPPVVSLQPGTACCPPAVPSKRPCPPMPSKCCMPSLSALLQCCMPSFRSASPLLRCHILMVPDGAPLTASNRLCHP